MDEGAGKKPADVIESPEFSNGADFENDIPNSPPATGMGAEFTWSAPEFIAYQKNSSWFAGLAIAGALLTIGMYAITRDRMSAFVMVVVIIAAGVVGSRKPKIIQYAISEDGVHVGERFFEFSSFKSYAVVQEGMSEGIWLRQLRRFRMPVILYYSDEDAEHVAEAISGYLPNEQREPGVIDRISHRLHF